MTNIRPFYFTRSLNRDLDKQASMTVSAPGAYLTCDTAYPLLKMR
jgi:hypothetical protein